MYVPIHLYGWEEDQGPFSQKSSGKKNCVTQILWRLRTAYRSHSTPSSRPHFQFGQFLVPIEIIVSFRMIKKTKQNKTTSRYDFRSILNTDFAC